MFFGDLIQNPAVDEQSIKSRLELLTPIASGTAITVYVVGFLVLSVHHASFGISQSSLLRPRILSTGVLFCVLALLPAAETIRLTDFTPQTTRFFRVPNTFSMLRGMLIPLVITGILARFILAAEVPFKGHSIWAFAAWVGGSLIASLPVENRRPLYKRLIFATTLAWILFAFYKAHDATLWLLLGWFIWCACMTFDAYRPLRDFDRLQTINLIQTILGIVVTIAFFGYFIYPIIPSGWGGGTSVPAIMCFGSGAPAATVLPHVVWILDETDAGFYFLQDKAAKKAVFIPRSTVTEIQYGDTTPQQVLSCTSVSLPQVHDSTMKYKFLDAIR